MKEEIQNESLKVKESAEKKKDDNFMLYIPRKKHKDWEIKNNKVYLVFHHDKTVEKFMRWLVKKPSVSDVELDDLGTTVWLNVNGENTVHDIAQVLKGKFGEKVEPVNERLIMYLRYLNKKGWIAFDRGNQE